MHQQEQKKKKREKDVDNENRRARPRTCGFSWNHFHSMAWTIVIVSNLWFSRYVQRIANVATFSQQTNLENVYLSKKKVHCSKSLSFKLLKTTFQTYCSLNVLCVSTVWLSNLWIMCNRWMLRIHLFVNV